MKVDEDNIKKINELINTIARRAADWDSRRLITRARDAAQRLRQTTNSIKIEIPTRAEHDIVVLAIHNWGHITLNRTHSNQVVVAALCFWGANQKSWPPIDTGYADLPEVIEQAFEWLLNVPVPSTI